MLEQGKTLRQWRNFARYSQRHLAITEIVLKQQNYKCGLCNRPSRGGFHMHHIDYLHACIHDHQKPDCADCKINSPESFQGCASRVVAVHAGCHYKIHEDEIEIKRAGRQSKPKKAGAIVTSKAELRKIVLDIYNGLEDKEKTKSLLLSRIRTSGLQLTRNNDSYFTVMSSDGRRARFRWENLEIQD